MSENPRPFLIPLRRRWALAILPVVCVLYFALVITLVALDRTVSGLTHELLALVGAGLFLVTLLVEIPFFLRRRAKRVRAEPVEERALQDEPPEPLARGPALDHEFVTTSETQAGMRVVEYSRPAKSRNRGLVYAKTYVPVAKDVVLRVETPAAEPRDL